MAHVSAGDQSDASVCRRCRLCDGFARGHEGCLIRRVHGHDDSWTLPTGFRGEPERHVAPWSSEHSVMETVSSPRCAQSMATLSASRESAGKSIARCGKPNAVSDPRRRSPPNTCRFRNAGRMRRDYDQRISGCGNDRSRGFSASQNTVVTASFWRRPPTPGIRMGACGISAPQTTRPPGWGSLT